MQPTRPHDSTEANAEPLRYYTAPGLMTDPGDCAAMLVDLPSDIAALCTVVQGQLIHIFWAERYGVTPDETRKKEVEIRQVSEMLTCIRAVDDRPLTTARPLEQRLIGNCRDFSVMLCATLRHQGIPARARCGFGTYFLPDHYEDHWVCEYWSGAEQRWVLVDAQLDAFQQRALSINFDPLDVPRDRFLVAGQAWQMCRSGQADPDKFGIFDMHGMGFIRGNLVRDLLALNKIELLPWDGWGLIAQPDDTLTGGDRKLLDRIAALTTAGVDRGYDEIRALYRQDARLTMPATWPEAHHLT